MDDYEAAVKATASKVRAAERNRDDHIAAVVAALRAGKRPTDVASWSPFSAAYLRRLARDAGIPPAKRQRSPSS
jgi:thiamine pyrophosphate-dependent acetolactate synthase large subunit-like protein